jgi:hypothetical protein
MWGRASSLTRRRSSSASSTHTIRRYGPIVLDIVVARAGVQRHEEGEHCLRQGVASGVDGAERESGGSQGRAGFLAPMGELRGAGLSVTSENG